MRGIDGARNSFRRLIAVASGFLLVLVIANANAVIWYGVSPQGHRYVQSGGDYAITKGDFSSWKNESINGQSTRIPPTQYHSKNLQVPWSTLGRLGKGLIQRGGTAYLGYQALKSLIDGAGWAIDELQKQVMDGESRPDEQRPPGTEMVCYQLRCSTSAQGLIPYLNSVVAPLYVTQVLGRSGVWQSYRLNNNGGVTAAWQTVSQWTPDFGTGHTPGPVTDQQLGELMRNSPDVVNAVLIDPDTGAPIQTPEIVDAMNQLRRALEQAGTAAGETVQEGTDIVVSNNWGNETQEATPSEWPSFCTWASVVCDFIEWWKTDETNKEPLEVPWDEAPVEEVDWESGLSGGTCPAPFTVAVLDGDVEFSWDGVCGFVETVRPFMIAIAMLVGAFIIAGQRSGKSA